MSEHGAGGAAHGETTARGSLWEQQRPVSSDTNTGSTTHLPELTQTGNSVKEREPELKFGRVGFDI